MRIRQADVVVIGAGPAGMSAAIEAARAGASVVVVEENPRPGGQIYRRPPPEFVSRRLGRPAADDRAGASLRAQLESLPVTVLTETLAWGCWEDRTFDLAGPHGIARLRGEVVIVAAGAFDRPVPVPGWTLPGVFTVGGAQTILKSQRILPGRRLLLAGAGPLQLVVASQLVKAGADVAAVAEAVPARALLPHIRTLLKTWPLTTRGLQYRLDVWRASVPWVAPAVLVRIDGKECVESATIATADADWTPVAGTERTFDVDAVCVGYGLVPSVELLRLMGAELVFNTNARVWEPLRSDTFETSVPRTFAVGDGAGVAGALVAAEEGRMAGVVAAHVLGRLSAAAASAGMRPIRRRLRALAAFRTAMDQTYRVGEGLRSLADHGTVICRCEEVTVGEIHAALADGASTLNQVKAWTRCGMGPCQGRMCSLPAADLVSAAIGRRIEELSTYAPRPPVKPVSMDALVGPEGGEVPDISAPNAGSHA